MWLDSPICTRLDNSYGAKYVQYFSTGPLTALSSFLIRTACRETALPSVVMTIPILSLAATQFGRDLFFQTSDHHAAHEEALGKQGIDYLVERIQNPEVPVEQRIIYPKLILRDSTSAPNRRRCSYAPRSGSVPRCAASKDNVHDQCSQQDQACNERLLKGVDIGHVIQTIAE